MIKKKGGSALLLLAGLLAGSGAPLHAGSDGLDPPVFVAPSDNTAQQPPAENQAAAPDPLANVDRSPHENTSAQSSAPAAAAAAPSARTAPTIAASGEHSVWDETSLIGKIFIGFGALLTIASAARMFIA
jgi:hypothetical protein